MLLSLSTSTVPPSVEDPGQVEEAETVTGNDLRLNCPAFGIPLPKVTWFHQEVAIRSNSSKHVLEHEGWTLLIRQTTSEDAKRYFCRAENIAGEAEKTFNVEILGEEWAGLFLNVCVWERARARVRACVRAYVRT